MVDRHQEIEASTAASEAEGASEHQELEEELKGPEQDVGPSAHQATLAQMDNLINGEGDEEQINSSVQEFLDKIRRETEE